MYDTLASLCACDGVSGHEESVRNRILSLGSFDAHHVDPLGNLLCFKGDGDAPPSVVLDAHMDEVGFLVRHIDKDGFITLDALGGIDPRVLEGAQLTVHGREPLRAVVGDLPPHLSKEEKAPKLQDLPVDTGLSGKEVRDLVPVGSPVCFWSPLRRLGSSLVSGKALDNRAGCAVLCSVSHSLPKECNALFLFSVQEEVGVRGATTALFGREDAPALCIDATHAGMPGVDERLTRPLGSGPVIGMGPAVDPGLHARLVHLAGSLGIPHTVKAYPGRMPTNLRALQVTGKGMRGALASLPARYLHTPCEVMDLRDLDACTRLAGAYVESWCESTGGAAV